MDFETMYQELATPLGFAASSTKLLAERKLWLNRAYRELLAKHDWPNSYEDEFQTIAAETDGTVTCALGSQNMTVAGETWTATSGTERRKIKVGNTVMDLTAVASGGCTLAKPSPVEISGEDYVLFQAEFALPASVGDITAAWIDSYAPMARIRTPQQARLLGLEHREGAPPQHIHIIGYDGSGNLIVRLHGYPAAIYHVHYKFEKRITALSDAADVPDLLPLDAHFLLPMLAEIHLQGFQGEATDVRRAEKSFYRAWSEYQVKVTEPIGFELEPEMFRSYDA